MALTLVVVHSPICEQHYRSCSLWDHQALQQLPSHSHCLGDAGSAIHASLQVRQCFRMRP